MSRTQTCTVGAMAFFCTFAMAQCPGRWEAPPPQKSARWTTRPVCAADYDCDSRITTNDLFVFLRLFFENRPEADMNGNGEANSQDFFDFVVAFFGEC